MRVVATTLLSLSVLGASLAASGPAFWTTAAPADFLKGTSDGVYVNLNGTLTAEQVTDALMELRRAGDVSLIPEENQKTLGPDDHAAAISYGNQNRHLIAVDGRRVDQLLPAQSTPPPTVETDSPTVEPTPDPTATTTVPDTTEGMVVDTQTVAE